MPPEPHRLVTNVDTAFEPQVFDLVQRQRIADVHHDREANNLGRTVETAEGICIHGGYGSPMTRSSRVSLTTPLGTHPRRKPWDLGRTICDETLDLIGRCAKPGQLLQGVFHRHPEFRCVEGQART